MTECVRKVAVCYAEAKCFTEVWLLLYTKWQMKRESSKFSVLLSWALQSSKFPIAASSSISFCWVFAPLTPLFSHSVAEMDSISMKTYDAIEDDDNSHLTFTNLLSGEMGMEEGKEKKDGQMRGSGRWRGAGFHPLFLFFSSPPHCAHIPVNAFVAIIFYFQVRTIQIIFSYCQIFSPNVTDFIHLTDCYTEFLLRLFSGDLTFIGEKLCLNKSVFNVHSNWS